MKRILVKGKAYGETYDYECKELSRSKEEFVLGTISKPEHEVVLRRKSLNDDLTHWEPNREIVCTFMFDRTHITIAECEARGQELLIRPCEY